MMDESPPAHLHVTRSTDNFVYSQHELLAKREGKIENVVKAMRSIGACTALLGAIYCLPSSDDYRLRASLREKSNIEYSLEAEKENLMNGYNAIPLDSDSRELVKKQMRDSRHTIQVLEDKLNNINQKPEMKEYRTERILGMSAVLLGLGLIFGSTVYSKHANKKLKKSRRLLEERSYPKWANPSQHTLIRFD